MPHTVTQCLAPEGSEIARRLHGAHFHDSYRLTLATGTRPALQLYLDAVARTPAWIDASMALRNRVVSLLFGLKDLGRLGQIDRSKPVHAYRVGDRVGIFSLHYLSDDEVVLRDADKHLEAQVSLHRTASAVSLTTVVHIRNLLGRLYLLPVLPMHRRIVPAMMKRLAR